MVGQGMGLVGAPGPQSGLQLALTTFLAVDDGAASLGV